MSKTAHPKYQIVEARPAVNSETADLAIEDCALDARSREIVKGVYPQPGLDKKNVCSPPDDYRSTP